MSDATISDGAVPSPAAPAPGGPHGGVAPDRRTAPRVTLLIRIAKAVGAAGEFFCIVRDASAQGIRIKTFHPLPPGEKFDLELTSGERHAIVKVWEEGDHAGFRFVVPVDIDRLVAETPAGLRKREISLNCLVAGVITAHSGECDVRLHHISQYGAWIECGLHLATGEPIRLETDTLPPGAARVRTRRGTFYSVMFERVFRFDELARLCGVVGSQPNRAAITASGAPHDPLPPLAAASS